MRQGRSRRLAGPMLLALALAASQGCAGGTALLAEPTGNEKAAKLSGINTERLTFLTFVNMGALAALAGMIILTGLSRWYSRNGHARRPARYRNRAVPQGACEEPHDR